MSTPTLPVRGTKSTAHDARAIANYFLDLGERDGIAIDHLKLQKLVYFCHGWHLALTGEPLIFQTVVAWPHGPVIRDLYWEFKQYGRAPISGRATIPPDGVRTREHHPMAADLSENSRSVAGRTWDVFKNFSGTELRAMSHDEGTPWQQVVAGLKPETIRDLPIPDRLIREYFEAVAKEM